MSQRGKIQWPFGYLIVVVAVFAARFGEVRDPTETNIVSTLHRPCVIVLLDTGQKSTGGSTSDEHRVHT